MRVFIAIRLNNDIISHLKYMVDELAPHFEKARFTHADNYHLTLKFIGETDTSGYKKIISVIRAIASETDKFIIRTLNPGSFKKKNKYIFYCAVNESLNLTNLHNILSDNLEKAGISIHTSKFIPHITLVREAVLKNEYPLIESKEKEMKVNSISLMESTRINGKLTYIPRYTVELGGSKNVK